MQLIIHTTSHYSKTKGGNYYISRSRPLHFIFTQLLQMICIRVLRLEHCLTVPLKNKLVLIMYCRTLPAVHMACCYIFDAINVKMYILLLPQRFEYSPLLQRKHEVSSLNHCKSKISTTAAAVLLQMNKTFWTGYLFSNFTLFCFSNSLAKKENRTEYSDNTTFVFCSINQQQLKTGQKEAVRIVNSFCTF